MNSHLKTGLIHAMRVLRCMYDVSQSYIAPLQYNASIYMNW